MPTVRDVLAGGPVIAAVTSDDRAQAVLEVALQLSESLERQLVVVHAQQADLPPGVSAAPAGQERLKATRAEEAEQFLDELLAGSGAEEASRRSVSGDAGPALVDAARDEEASLVVLGTAGRGALATALGGSVSRHLSANAPCPVVVVPPSVSA